MIAIFDSNILIDFIQGIRPALEEVERNEQREISVITWMEVMTGVTPDHETSIRTLLSRFHKLPITDEIAEQAVLERRSRRIKFPDSILIATAIVRGGQLITRNTRDFPREENHVRIPYRLPVS